MNCEIIICQIQEGKIKKNVRMKEGTAWFEQIQMSQLFGKAPLTIPGPTAHNGFKKNYGNNLMTENEYYFRKNDSPPEIGKFQSPSQTIGSIIRGFKIATIKKIKNRIINGTK
jgi:hypothetical protein